MDIRQTKHVSSMSRCAFPKDSALTCVHKLTILADSYAGLSASNPSKVKVVSSCSPVEVGLP